jgi:lipopolysaccharide/colanic/teichoic acid biosynthesis glycosyltransferase
MNTHEFFQKFHFRRSYRQPVISQERFSTVLAREIERTERTRQRFAYVIFTRSPSFSRLSRNGELVDMLSSMIRMTDIIGHIDEHRIGSILFNTDERGAVLFCEKINTVLRQNDLNPLTFSLRCYPDERNTPFGHIERDRAGASDEQMGRPRDKKVLYSSEIDESSLITGFRGLPLWKRTFDYCFALICLLLCSFPFLLIALGIKLSSSGPVFFKQVRVGFGGRPFTFWKFRTMTCNADNTNHQQYLKQLICEAKENDNECENKPMKKLENDPQIFPFGKFLRMTCLDELPQLFNILRGEMSFIGPRPALPYEVEEYESWYKKRFRVLPGMTGLWQVSGKNKLSFKQMMRLDIQYTRKISPLLDFFIILLTPIAIFQQLKEESIFH